MKYLSWIIFVAISNVYSQNVITFKKFQEIVPSKYKEYFEIKRGKKGKFPKVQLLFDDRDSSFYFGALNVKEDSIWNKYTPIGLKIGLAKTESYLVFLKTFNDTFRIDKSHFLILKNPLPFLFEDAEFTRVKINESPNNRIEMYQEVSQIVSPFIFYERIDPDFSEKIKTIILDSNIYIQKHESIINNINISTSYRIIDLTNKIVTVIDLGKSNEEVKTKKYSFNW